jgi:hypothetical protein
VFLLRGIVLAVLACMLALMGAGRIASAGSAATGAAAGAPGPSGYAEALAADTVTSLPCGYVQRLVRGGHSGPGHAPTGAEPDLSPSAYSFERPACYAEAFISRTLEAGLSPHDGWGSPASLPCFISKGPFGGAAAAHARL